MCAIANLKFDCGHKLSGYFRHEVKATKMFCSLLLLKYTGEKLPANFIIVLKKIQDDCILGKKTRWPPHRFMPIFDQVGYHTWCQIRPIFKHISEILRWPVFIPSLKKMCTFFQKLPHEKAGCVGIKANICLFAQCVVSHFAQCVSSNFTHCGVSNSKWPMSES